tara:strand:+ start:1992 stop:2288 length:297 start_codon:yes stop_codon:yes gene_type:complete
LGGVPRIGLDILGLEERLDLRSRALRSIRGLLEHSEEEATPIYAVVPDPHAASELLGDFRLFRRQHRFGKILVRRFPVVVQIRPVCAPFLSRDTYKEW